MIQLEFNDLEDGLSDEQRERWLLVASDGKSRPKVRGIRAEGPNREGAWPWVVTLTATYSGRTIQRTGKGDTYGEAQVQAIVALDEWYKSIEE